MNPQEFRALVRQNKWHKPTSGVCSGYAQANLLIIHKDLAEDFLIFTQYNPKPCPVLEVLEPGKFELKQTAKDSDIRTDIPKYRIFKDGVLTNEVENIIEYWQDDFVSFLLGCSFSFEEALLNAKIPIRNIEENKNVSMYKTNIKCKSSKHFHGNMVVSMRPIPNELVNEAKNITSLFPKVHGAPVYIGDHEQIGINDLSKPDFGDIVEIKQNETPVFWACGVTPQVVVMETKPKIAITHSPGYMFVTDVLNKDLRE